MKLPDSQDVLARPGLPTRYSPREVARLFGISPATVLRCLLDGEIRGLPDGRRWWIPRSEVVRTARLWYADRPVRLARILAQPRGVLALTDDPAVRRAISRFHPQHADTPFALGQLLTVVPCGVLVVDWQTTGSATARDIAHRVRLCVDRPALVGILPEDIGRQERGWETLLPRPMNRGVLQDAIHSFLR